MIVIVESDLPLTLFTKNNTTHQSMEIINNGMNFAVETEFAYFGGNSTGFHWGIFRSLAINGSVQILFLTYLLEGV